MQELEVVLAEPPLRVRFCPGPSTRLIVCFSGVGTERHDEPPIEFFNIIGAGTTNPVLFVSDQSRSWLNADGMADKIVDIVTEYTDRLNPTEVVFIGNSMGATMALHLANLIPVDRVIAITPQYSAKPDIVPEEMRWRYFRSKIQNYPFPSVDKWPDCKNVFVMHGSTDSELAHALRFPAAKNGVIHFILSGHGHNLAKTIHGQGRLAGLVAPMMVGRPWHVRQQMKRLGGMPIEEFRKDLAPSTKAANEAGF